MQTSSNSLQTRNSVAVFCATDKMTNWDLFIIYSSYFPREKYRTWNIFICCNHFRNNSHKICYATLYRISKAIQNCNAACSFVLARAMSDSAMKFVFAFIEWTKRETWRRRRLGRLLQVQTIGDTDLYCCNYITHGTCLTILTLLRDICFKTKQSAAAIKQAV